MRWFESIKSEEMIEVRLFDGFSTLYEGRARVKNKKELAQMREDLEAKGVKVESLWW